MDEKRSKLAIKASARGKAKQPIPERDKGIFSVYLSKKSYAALKTMHGRQTSKIINDLVDAYLLAMREQGKN